MAENKTQATDKNVREFIDDVPHKRRRENALELLEICREVTGREPVIWGSDLIGFGRYAYQRADKSRHEFFKFGFSPRKANMVVYAMSGAKARPDLLARLGPHKTGAACLYLGDFRKIDLGVLREIIAADWAEMTARYG